MRLPAVLVAHTTPDLQQADCGHWLVQQYPYRRSFDTACLLAHLLVVLLANTTQDLQQAGVAVPGAARQHPHAEHPGQPC